MTEKIQELSKKYSGVLQGGDITKLNITNDIKSIEEEYEKFVGFKENKRSLSQYKNICVELNNKMGSTLEIVDKITKFCSS